MDRAAPADEPSDAELARRLAGASADAARALEAELYRRLAPRVRLYGLRHLRSEAAAADLVQEVLLMTFERLRAGKVREPERLASFVLGTCRMVVLDLRRGHRRRERLLRLYADDVPVAAAADPPLPDHARLGVCLDGLSERERAVVVMTFYDERSAEEVARELGLSPGNVRVIRHRALERLRACLQAGAGDA